MIRTFVVAISGAMLGVGLVAASARADVELPAILSSHMVLQREQPVPIWGSAEPGETVTVTFRDQKKTAVADPQGAWLVRLDSLTAGGPATLTVSGSNTITLEDVLVGEVWIGSGQSNMAGAVHGYEAKDPELASLVAAGPYPRIRLARATGGWKPADAQSIADFSALLFPFGVKLQRELDVPVGLMQGAVGGTPSCRWLTAEMFAADALCTEQVAQSQRRYDPARAQRNYEAALERWEVATEKAKVEKARAPRKPDPPAAPGHVQSGRFGNLYDEHIKPLVPFAVRGVLWDQGESQTAVEGVDQFAVMGALIHGWRQAWNSDFPFLTVQKPSGGGPAFDPADPITRGAEAFAPLPADVPRPLPKYPADHLRLREHPATFLVTATDLEAGTHPTNKSGYAYRAARVALGGVYGRHVAIYGPTYASHAVDGAQLRVTFAHVGSGLRFKHGEKLQGFAIAGRDRTFHWAEATIAGDSVLLHSDKVAAPVAVRYAWAQPHPWANLFNADGLPALSFSIGQ
jgi:sialate O-acetylesterase